MDDLLFTKVNDRLALGMKGTSSNCNLIGLIGTHPLLIG